MARTRRQYSRVTDAETMISQLAKAYPDVLWRVRPSSITVMGIDNSTRSDKNHVLAKTKLVKGVEKAIMELNNIKIQYVIELYCDDWNTWSQPQKQWIIFHELLHVHEDGDKLVKHDCEDFNVLLDAAGLNWVSNKALPDMLNDEIEFDLNLRPGLPDESEGPEENDTIPEKEDEVVFEPEE